MKTTLALLIASLLLPTFGIGQDTDLTADGKFAVREYDRKIKEARQSLHPRTIRDRVAFDDFRTGEVPPS